MSTLFACAPCLWDAKHKWINNYISQLIRFASVSSQLADFNTLLMLNISNRGIVIINFGKLFLSFIVDTTNWFLNTKSLLQGVFEPYGDLVYKFIKTCR